MEKKSVVSGEWLSDEQQVMSESEWWVTEWLSDWAMWVDGHGEDGEARSYVTVENANTWYTVYSLRYYLIPIKTLAEVPAYGNKKYHNNIRYLTQFSTFFNERRRRRIGSLTHHSFTHSLTYSLDVSSKHKNSRYVFSAEYDSCCHCLSFRMLCCSKLYCNWIL